MKSELLKKTRCKYCNPISDYEGTEINFLNINTKTTRGNDKNNAKAYLSTDFYDKKKIVVLWSWYGKVNKRFEIKANYCPICGDELRNGVK